MANTPIDNVLDRLDRALEPIGRGKLTKQQADEITDYFVKMVQSYTEPEPNPNQGGLSNEVHRTIDGIPIIISDAIPSNPGYGIVRLPQSCPCQKDIQQG